MRADVRCDDLVDHVVGRIGAVMEQRELLGAGALRDDHARARGRVAPAAAQVVVVIGVHRVVDQQVGVARERERLGQRLVGRRVLDVGQVRDASCRRR